MSKATKVTAQALNNHRGKKEVVADQRVMCHWLNHTRLWYRYTGFSRVINSLLIYFRVSDVRLCDPAERLAHQPQRAEFELDACLDRQVDIPVQVLVYGTESCKDRPSLVYN